ncbi:MAG TPA: putative toxin-antitoxin system toxin component, PIN family [Solirubrobacteraceae bacterium]
MSRIVLDCNVFVSALLSPRGSPAQILDQWADGDFDLVVSPLLLAELETVLSRPKFHASIDRVHIDALLTGLIEDAVLVGDPPLRPGLTPDPGDDYLVALAREADAQCIVSGDVHLTQLVDPSPPVLTPREFVQSRK